MSSRYHQEMYNNIVEVVVVVCHVTVVATGHGLMKRFWLHSTHCRELNEVIHINAQIFTSPKKIIMIVNLFKGNQLSLYETL